MSATLAAGIGAIGSSAAAAEPLSGTVSGGHTAAHAPAALPIVPPPWDAAPGKEFPLAERMAAENPSAAPTPSEVLRKPLIDPAWTFADWGFAAGGVIPAGMTGWVHPIPSARVTSCFGPRWGRLHAGVDLAAAHGTPIVAAGAGVVVSARVENGYGNAVLIDHEDGYLTHYGHMAVIGVIAGQRVVAGQRIGDEGSTGRSTGPHLHFEVHQGYYQNPIEPTSWMRAHGVEITGCPAPVSGSANFPAVEPGNPLLDAPKNPADSQLRTPAKAPGKAPAKMPPRTIPENAPPAVPSVVPKRVPVRTTATGTTATRTVVTGTDTTDTGAAGTGFAGTGVAGTEATAEARPPQQAPVVAPKHARDTTTAREPRHAAQPDTIEAPKHALEAAPAPQTAPAPHEQAGPQKQAGPHEQTGPQRQAGPQKQTTAQHQAATTTQKQAPKHALPGDEDQPGFNALDPALWKAPARTAPRHARDRAPEAGQPATLATLLGAASELLDRRVP